MTAMHYEFIAIPDQDVPRASNPLFQHLIDTCASETDKVISVWRSFAPEDMGFPSASEVVDGGRHTKAPIAVRAQVLRRVCRHS